MSLIKELQPFAKELSLYRENNTLPQGEVKKALEDIYDKYAPSNRKWGVMKTQRGCPTCLSDAMKCLTAAWLDNLVSFKAVPQVEQRDLVDQIQEEEKQTEIILTEADSIADLNDEPRPDNPTFDYTKLSWGQFRKYAKEQDINIKGKNRPQITEELKEKFKND